MLVLEGLVGLHRTIQLSFFSSDWGIDLDYCDIEWFVLETEIILSFEMVPKYCISDSSVDYEGYSISSGRQGKVVKEGVGSGVGYLGAAREELHPAARCTAAFCT